MRPMFVEVENLSRAFGNGASSRGVLTGISFRVTAGEVICILGVSGCGKTTLLNALAGMDPGIGGRVSVRGRGSGAPRLGYMLQEPGLLPWRTVLRNAELGLEILGTTAASRQKKARETLAFVGLHEDVWALYPSQLSGGMRQRVALARTLAVEPDLLLLDEALAQLDYKLRRRLALGIRDAMKSRGAVTVMVTHSIEEASVIADRCIVLAGTPATVVADVQLPPVGDGSQNQRYRLVSEAAETAHVGGDR